MLLYIYSDWRNVIMNNGFDYLINSASEFEQTHIKKYLSGKKQRIKKIFKEFCFIFEDCSTSLKETTTEINIKIQTPQLISGRGNGTSFNELINDADIINIYPINSDIVFELTYNLYEWIPNK